MIALALLSGAASYLLFAAGGMGEGNPANRAELLPDGTAAHAGGSGASSQAAGTPNAKAEMRKAETQPTYHAGPQYRLFRDDGRINGELLALAGIDPSRADEVQELTGRWWAKLSEEMDAKRELIEAESNREERIFSYVVKGDPELAEARKKQLAEELEKQFGAGAARVLSLYIGLPEHFAGFGHGTLKIRIQPAKAWDGELTLTLAKYSVVDPISGKQLLKGGTTDADRYAMKFGNAFKRND